MFDVSIVVVSYNTRDITCQCIQSIVEQTHGISYEIITVDNDSSDGSVEKICKDFPQVILIESGKNLGFAAGQNLGILQSKGEYILILNSDIIILDNAIAKLVSALKEGPKNLAVVGPRVQQLDGSLAPSARRANLGTCMNVLGVINRHFPFRRFLPEQFMRRVAGRVLGRFHDNYRSHDVRADVDYVDGMCAMVRRSAIEKVGLFDEQFFFDYEIIELSNRIKRDGWSIELFPDAQVIHIGHVSRKKTSRILIETIRSELTYYAKQCPKNFKLIYRLNYISAILKLVYLHLVSLMYSRKVEIEIYKQIVSVCKNFEPENALREDRIPRFPTQL